MPHNVVSTRKLGRSRKTYRGSDVFADNEPGSEEDSERHLESIEPSVSGDTADEIARRSTPGCVGASEPSQPKRIVNRLKCELMGRRSKAQIFGGIEGDSSACHLFGTQADPLPCTDGGRVWQDGYRQGGRSPETAGFGRKESRQSKSRSQIRHQEFWEKSEYPVVVGAWESHARGEGGYRSGSKFGEGAQVMTSRYRRGRRS
jgi:hypothetical protein